QESVEANVWGSIEDQSTTTKSTNDWDNDGWDDFEEEEAAAGDAHKPSERKASLGHRSDSSDKKSSGNGWDSEEAATWNSLAVDPPSRPAEKKPLTTST